MKTKKEKGTALERKPSKGLQRRLAGDTRGLSTVEYLILLVLIAVAGITVWKKIGGTITTKATKANTDMTGM
jgi:Flp pilus assembly pilin Flp